MNIVNVVVTWMHLLAAVTLVGAMVYMLFVVMPSLAAIDPPPLRGKFMAATLARYTRIAWTAIAVLVLSGVISTLGKISSPVALLSTTYGVVLLAKIVVALVMIALAFVASFVLNPRMAAIASRPSPAAGGQSPAGGPPAVALEAARLQAQIMALAKTNLFLGMLVLLAVAVLHSI